MLCLKPVLLAGYMLTQSFSPTGDHAFNNQTNLDGLVVEAMTCEKGWGTDFKASTNGLYGIGAQYGLQYAHDRYSITILPKGGLSYVDHPVRELPQRTQFEVGAQLLLGYDQARVGIEYWHLSNAGMTYPNIGVNMVILQAGWSF